ncbi:flavin reductase family protein [Streptomyces tauricus]|uniref:Flavin reductase family protein n=1 Tax=Streptomyces tauricus TaxID=68274 RepID=A0ABZ1J9Y5_9ACTN|nr:flavin reductase family protein [Streptomyces tauricus]
MTIHATATEPVTASLLRTTARCLPTGVTVVTSGLGPDVHGMTVNSFTTLSLEPPLVSFSVRHDARIRGPVERTGGFVVNVLAAEQTELARWFANRNRPLGAESFAEVRTEDAPVTGGVRIAGTVGYFACRAVRFIELGDHVLVVGLVHECGAREKARQLLFVDGELRAAQDRSAEPPRAEEQ